jgi:hypothetical protein
LKCGEGDSSYVLFAATALSGWPSRNKSLDLFATTEKMENGAPGEIRTPDLLVRSQTLYPAELRAHRVLPNAI